MCKESILIFGYGKWSQKVFQFLKKRKKFNKIYVKTSSKFFRLYPKKKEFTVKEFRSKIKNTKNIHICVPTKDHFKIVRDYNLNNKNIIIEKPLVKKKIELDKIKRFFKLNKIIVNYIDLYNPLLLKIKKKINYIENLNIDFGNKELYLKKYDCLNEWLDHPLAIILFLFNKFSKLRLIYYENIKQKKKYFEKIHLRYNYKKININIKINTNFPKSYRKICVEKKSGSIKINLRKIPKSVNINSINFLYNDLKTKKINYFQKFSFHKKILLEKQRIRKTILKEIN